MQPESIFQNHKPVTEAMKTEIPVIQKSPKRPISDLVYQTYLRNFRSGESIIIVLVDGTMHKGLFEIGDENEIVLQIDDEYIGFDKESIVQFKRLEKGGIPTPPDGKKDDDDSGQSNISASIDAENPVMTSSELLNENTQSNQKDDVDTKDGPSTQKDETSIDEKDVPYGEKIKDHSDEEESFSLLQLESSETRFVVESKLQDTEYSFEIKNVDDSGRVFLIGKDFSSVVIAEPSLFLPKKPIRGMSIVGTVGILFEEEKQRYGYHLLSIKSEPLLYYDIPITQEVKDKIEMLEQDPLVNPFGSEIISNQSALLPSLVKKFEGNKWICYREGIKLRCPCLQKDISVPNAKKNNLENGRFSLCSLYALRDSKSLVLVLADAEPILDDVPSNLAVDSNNRTGIISAYYPDRSYGFLIESGTQQTWHFYLDRILDAILRKTLLANPNMVRIPVVFSGTPQAVYGKYPSAENIRRQDNSTDAMSESISAVNIPSSAITAGLPHDGSFYARAKFHDVNGQLIEAENLYRKEIELGPSSPWFKSAIKDLAWLLGRLGKTEEGIQLIRKHTSHLGAWELSSFRQMLAALYMKIGKYNEAATIYENLVKFAKNPNAKCELIRQRANCFLLNGNKNKAEQILSEALSRYPENQILKSGFEKTKNFDASDESSSQLFDSVEVDIMRISPLSSQRIDALDISEIVQINGREPTSDDLKALQRQFEQLSDDSWGEKAKLFLARCKIRQLLLHKIRYNDFANYYLCLSKDKTTEPASSIVFCIEGLKMLAPLRPKEEIAKKTIEKIRSALLKRLQLVCEKITSIPENDLYEKVIARYSKSIKVQVPDNSLSPYGDDWTAFQNTLKQLINVTRSQIDLLRAGINCQALSFTFTKDEDRTRVLKEGVDEVFTYASAASFSEKENAYLRLQKSLGSLVNNILDTPTPFSLDILYPFISSLLKKVTDDFHEFESASPNFVAERISPQDTIDQDGYVALRLCLKAQNPCSPPIRSLRVTLDQDTRDTRDFFLADPERGTSLNVDISFRATHEEIEKQNFVVSLLLEYCAISGENKKQIIHSVPVHLDGSEFSEINNPYKQWAGGNYVTDPNMFFGRTALVQEICCQVSQKSGHQWYVLYGQKRSGKSSILDQVGKKLPKYCFYTNISAQSLGYSAALENRPNLLKLVALELRDKIAESIESGILDISATELPEISNGREVYAIRQLSHLLKRQNFLWVVAIDEFTDLLDNDERIVLPFLHAWKALLEDSNALFNAIVVGQSTMSVYLNGYPNDFSIATPRELTYLVSAHKGVDSARSADLLGSRRYRAASVRL